MADKLSRSIIFKGFRRTLISQFGEKNADQIWLDANTSLAALQSQYPDLDSDSTMMILPAAALYSALHEHAPEQALPLLTAYGTKQARPSPGSSTVLHLFPAFRSYFGSICPN